MFIREDLPVAHQLIQTNHATRGITASYHQGEGIPNIVLIGVKDIIELLSVKETLSKLQIPSYYYTEPDNDFGLTSICTIAIDRTLYPSLRKYKPYGKGANAEH